MIKKTLFPLFLSLCCISHGALADTTKGDSNLNKLKKEVSESAFDSAWLTAQTLKDEYLGDPAFDFLYGVTALANDQAEYAVFAFERVTANRPEWLDAQYLLAKANYKIANYQGAITTSQLLLSNPKTSEKLKESANTLLNLSQSKLDKQSFYLSQRVSLSLGHDSNINSGTTEDNIFIPSTGDTFLLNDESKEVSDNYGALSYQASGSKIFSQVSKIIFSGKGTVHNFQDESQYNRMFADLAFQYQHSFDFGRISVGLKFTPLWLDDELYRTRTTLTTNFEKQLTSKWLMTTGLNIGKTNNKISDALNTDNVSVSLAAHYFSNNVKHSLGLSYSDEKSDQDIYDYNSQKIATVSYSNLWLINNAWIASGMIAFQEKKYQDSHPFFLEQRDDDMWLASASLQYNQSKRWSYNLNINAQDKDSNLSLFSYQRSDISLTANMNF
ncbi:hypothetical protein [Pseudocolwellia sp. HL-MZ7]|uniref:hypothetical protein n=1 Tax=Pseudocolwellia sp. HL-MZ7 TaxID=3400627 RepID=UPI003CE9F57A